MSVMTTNGDVSMGGDDLRKRVQIISDTNTSPTFSLETPNPKLMFTPLDMPTTAELMMKRCLAVNPFEATFREANQKISSGIAMAPTSAANQALEALEANGLVPMGGRHGNGSGLTPSTNMTDLLLKIPHTTLQQSPGIFSNISILAAAGHDPNDPGSTTRENLKTADISKLLSAVSAADSTAPRTADVLNAVLDMHSDRLHSINYINKPDFSAFLRSPSSSAPNSASILSAAMAIPSTSGGLLAPNKNLYSPLGSQTNLVIPSSLQEKKSPNGMDAGSSSSVHSWDLKVKKEVPYYMEDQGSLMSMNSTGNLSTSESEREVTPLHSTVPPAANPVGRPPNNGTPGRGRGRGRSTTAEMPPDERRNTILERNKAAAVRYRKRKKEEHDDMIGRVQLMEQEKNGIITQNQVLRREIDRLTALLAEREQRCVCLKGIPLNNDHRSDSPGRNLYQTGNVQQSSQFNNGMQHLKRPKM